MGNIEQIKPVVFEHDGKIYASSVDVAKYFGKRHKNVLQRIENIMEKADEVNGLNFQPIEYLDDCNRMKKAFEMTKDGFVFLVMGFTGREADKFKWSYIAEFNRKEQELQLVRQQLPVTDKQAIGGIVKGIIHKNITPVLDRLENIVTTQQMLIDGKATVERYIPALEVAKEKKVRQKGRAPVVQKISNSLTHYSQMKGYTILRDRWTGKRMFDRAAVDAWYRDGGWYPIQAYINEKEGQKVFKLPM